MRLSEIVGRYVELKHYPQESMGLCPFHKERTPSFVVNDKMALYRCFSCGETGDAVGFLMKMIEKSKAEHGQKVLDDLGLTKMVGIIQSGRNLDMVFNTTEEADNFQAKLFELLRTR